MKIAMIGLGKMGMGMTRRLIAHKQHVVAYDVNEDVVDTARSAGAAGAISLEDAIGRLEGKHRAVWLMLPAGEITSATLQQLALILSAGDIVIDGGNSYYRQSMERASMLHFKGIDMLDAGVSGGIWGEDNGFNLMVGGDQEAFKRMEPIFKALAPKDGYRRVGPSGAGHFTKMIHNGIEYGMMQSIAEGLELLQAKQEFNLNLPEITRLWMNGSVVRSWLMDLASRALADDANLDWAEPYVEDSGEGRWTAQEGIELAVPLPVITLSLQMRFRSRQKDSFGARLLAALRNQFGGHKIRSRQES